MLCVGPASIFSLQYSDLCGQMLPHTQVWTTVNSNRPKVTVTVTTQEVSVSNPLVSFHIVSPCSETTPQEVFLTISSNQGAGNFRRSRKEPIRTLRRRDSPE